mmetsp:Transcript_43301/g.104660  ORF Transcript_43301/g.104660 Transcript_43301/m.104660 type:complete len:311 (+) Transcript_43301:158-1090(+)|eukprot:CAMPEP_0113628218 /NCGR_PEP_ID=MMETSP0017_2-20120614/14620_1 /TAXON_ID=2856 /ORGANISM="Cylindrotheca closterium" /LENGTH=310 /DNA_ID=CAMNT_0000538513 /DNA_START=130 /DNA_END=1062 /DNA_ORIENTATION=+ /assembly_acc=CAM_ASM_000147
MMLQFHGSSSCTIRAKDLMEWSLGVLIISLLITSSAAGSLQSSSDFTSYNRHVISPHPLQFSEAEYANLHGEGLVLVNDATIDELMPADMQPLQYDDRKSEWESRYTSLKSLRKVFGGNRNRLWGDLDPCSARRLYRSLMPRVLMELVKSGVQPEDLAPLAYKARVAAKLYARERSVVPARLAATVYDGIRQFKRYGRFQGCGMTYEQIWEKYQQLVMNDRAYRDYEDLTEKDLTSKISLKIVERSCSTNESIDRRVLPATEVPATGFLLRVSETLETDVRKLLDTFSEFRKTRKSSRNHDKRKEERLTI